MQNPELNALVRASRTVNTPTPDIRERNRRRLAARIAAGAGAIAAASGTREAAAAIAGGSAAPGAGAGAGGSAALAGGLAKWVMVSFVTVASVGMGVGLYAARSRTPPTSTLGAPSPTETLVPALAAGEPGAKGAPSPQPASQPPDPAGSASVPRARQEPSAAPGSSALQARAFERELELLRSARRALDSGSPALALALLDQYAAQFPRGALKSECHAARILALCAAGRADAARQARDQFLKQQPGSPLAEQLRTTCGSGR